MADFLRLYAQSVVLMSGSGGRILYGKGQDIIRPTASTTKVITCILVLEMGNLEDSVTVSSTTASRPKIHLEIWPGEKYHLGDLLCTLMLESYNDATATVAENIGDSMGGFAALINEKAKNLGCGDTYLTTPNGPDEMKKNKDGTERTHSTTTSDLAAIMRYCVA